SFANASSVGAKTVNGPSPFSASIKSAALSAAASVLNDPALTAVSTMSFPSIEGFGDSLWYATTVTCLPRHRWPASAAEHKVTAAAVAANIVIDFMTRHISDSPSEVSRTPAWRLNGPTKRGMAKIVQIVQNDPTREESRSSTRNSSKSFILIEFVRSSGKADPHQLSIFVVRSGNRKTPSDRIHL